MKNTILVNGKRKPAAYLMLANQVDEIKAAA
jgi:hypothetical protein